MASDNRENEFTEPPRQRARQGMDDFGDDNEMTLMDFVNVILHEKTWFFGIAATVFALGVVAIFMMPKIYVSQASIMLEREGIYSANSTTSSQDVLSLRMHAIIRTILSTDSVTEILKKHDFVEDDTPKMEINQAILGFRNAANFEFDNVSVLRESTGREGLYSMGLTVSFESTSPEVSYEVTKELTDKLLGSNTGKLTAENQFKLDFLESNLEEVGAKLSKADAELTQFKEENALSLPEMQAIAVRRIDDLRYRILQSDDRLKVLRDRADENDAQLASVAVDSTVFSTEGQRIVSPQDQLELLLVEYASTKDKYGPSHPDRIEMEEKIAALRAHIGSGAEEGLAMELALAKQELASLKKRYSSQHPDIAAQEEKVAYMQQQLDSGRAKTREQKGSTTNPIYNNLLSRQRGITAEIKMERQSQQILQDELLDVEQRFQRMPEVDAKLRRLVSVRDRVESQYNKIEDEIQELLESADMQQAELFERFVLLEAPEEPFAPSKPNKGMLIPLLFIFSLVLAYAAAFIRHYMQAKIFSSEDVERVTTLPVFLIPEFND